jgi:hypothetical protein
MSRHVIVQTDPKEFQDKAEIQDLMRAALKSGFQYEFSQYINSEDYLLRVFNEDGELTATLSKEEMLDLGMEV